MNARTPKPPPLLPDETVQGWGGLRVPARELTGTDLHALTRGAVLTRGLGRSYGDASLPPSDHPVVVGSRRANRLLAFDADTGILKAEAGLALHDLVRALLPQGWFIPVSPGTWYVTLGGMVASDVHGKNHHVALTLGQHVLGLTMRVASGDVVTCSPTEHPDLFWATVGGMGLTGHILDVTLKMQRVPSPWIWQEAIQAPDFDSLLEGLEESATWPMAAGWIDTLATGRSFGRGVLLRGRWAEPHEAPLTFPRRGLQPTVPFDAPGFVLNDLTMKAFNTAYYWKQIRPRVVGPVTPHTWFTPLDSVKDWSRAYGKRGFTQHQAVIPKEAGLEAVRGFLEILTRRGGTGFLCVIKETGPEGDGLLSFPKPGMSLPLDLPVRPGLQELIDELNRYVLDVGGRIYLTKDAFTRRDHFQAMEADRLPRFQEVRRTWDPDLRIRSRQSVRLFGDPV